MLQLPDYLLQEGSPDVPHAALLTALLAALLAALLTALLAAHCLAAPHCLAALRPHVTRPVDTGLQHCTKLY